MRKIGEGGWYPNMAKSNRIDCKGEVLRSPTSILFMLKVVHNKMSGFFFPLPRVITFTQGCPCSRFYRPCVSLVAKSPGETSEEEFDELLQESNMRIVRRRFTKASSDGGYRLAMAPVSRNAQLDLLAILRREA